MAESWDFRVSNRDKWEDGEEAQAAQTSAVPDAPETQQVGGMENRGVSVRSCHPLPGSKD